MDGITDFADKHESGFHEFKWFDPKTKKLYLKEHLLEKLKKLNDTGIGLESKDFYIASGSTIELGKLNIDIFSIIIYLANLFIQYFYGKYLILIMILIIFM